MGRVSCGLLEREGGQPVWRLGAKREVMCALLAVGADLGQHPVQLASARGGGERVRRRGEQRMREAHPIPSEPDHLRALGTLEIAEREMR
jgi:hypothetical protein